MIVALCAALSAAATASAEPAKGAPPAAVKAADGAGEKAAAKSADGAGAKAAAKAGKGGEKAHEKRAEGAARSADKVKFKEDKAASHAKTAPTTKDQPTSKALKNETRRHARRLAQLEHAKDAAEDAKNTAKRERVNKLIGKENARHDRWVARHDAKTADKASAK